jgi:cytochrome c oxidase assembly protein subunit 11
MTNEPMPRNNKRPLRRDMVIAACCGVFAASMLGAAYAAVPLYNWFCRTTGFAGTTQVSQQAPAQVLGRTIAIRFDSNVAPGLPWKFEPEQNEIKLRIGEVATVHYKVVNEAARTISAQASYNVSPPQVGAYFDKINCFCFTEQRLKPGETREMTVVFYVDPAIAKDHDQDALNSITLSYTFYRLPEPEQPVAEAPDKNLNRL